MDTGLDFLRAFAQSDENTERLRALGLDPYDDAAYMAAVERDGPGSDSASTLHPICYVTEDEGEDILSGTSDRLWRQHQAESHTGDTYVRGCPACEGWYV